MEATSLSGCRILVVEDEYLIASYIEQVLQQAGAKVVGPTATVRQALALIRDESPEAAILDVSLRGGETVEAVVEELRERGVPVVFATANERDVYHLFAGAVVLSKPTRSGDLLAALEKILALPRA